MSLQSLAFDNKNVHIDFRQSEDGEVLGKQIMVVQYGKCQIERVFEWKDVESFTVGDEGIIQEWFDDSLDRMIEDRKCD
jgi:hypothetical protein